MDLAPTEGAIFINYEGNFPCMGIPPSVRTGLYVSKFPAEYVGRNLQRGY
jgi:hypothetical protein